MDWRYDEEAGLLDVAVGGFSVTCGFEVGDWLSFGSLEATANATVERIEQDARAERVANTTDVGLATGTVRVEQIETFDGGGLSRHLTLTALETVSLGDFVARFVLRDAEDVTARIGGEEYHHGGKNRYRQFETDAAELLGDEGKIHIELGAASVPDGFDVVLYMRDEPPDRWIVHARALARGTERGLLRLHRGPYRHVEALDRAVSRIPVLRDRLRYVRERTSIPSRYVPAQFVERVDLVDGADLQMNVSCSSTSQG